MSHADGHHHGHSHGQPIGQPSGRTASRRGALALEPRFSLLRASALNRTVVVLLVLTLLWACVLAVIGGAA